jgi:two-component system sensor histidine kinase/response regulator
VRVLLYEVGMHETSRARLVTYSVAVLVTAGCLLIRWPLWPVLGNTVPHMTFFPAVMIAAYFGGFWPGFLATILSGTAANYFLTQQLPTFRDSSVSDVAAMILFVAVGTIISGLSESLHRARRRLVARSGSGPRWHCARPRNASGNWRRTSTRSSG